VLVIAVALAVAACDRHRAPSGAGVPLDPGIELPKVVGAKPLDRQDRIVLELPATGAMRIQGEGVSLSELSQRLVEHRRLRGTHTYMLARNRDLIAMGRASDLYVLFRVDRRAAWRNVCYVFIVLMEEKIYRVQCAVEGGRFDAFLPVDTAVEWTELPNEIYFSIEVLVQQDPYAIVYRFGDRWSPDVSVACAWVKEATATARHSLEDAAVVGELRADSTAEFGAVMEVLAAMRAAGLDRVKFVGIAIPSEETRRMQSLPYPKRNTLIPGEISWEEEND